VTSVLSTENSHRQNDSAETSESIEERFPSAEILTDVASLFGEHPASVESVNHDKIDRVATK